MIQTEQTFRPDCRLHGERGAFTIPCPVGLMTTVAMLLSNYSTRPGEFDGESGTRRDFFSYPSDGYSYAMVRDCLLIIHRILSGDCRNVDTLPGVGASPSTGNQRGAGGRCPGGETHRMWISLPVAFPALWPTCSRKGSRFPFRANMLQSSVIGPTNIPATVADGGDAEAPSGRQLYAGFGVSDESQTSFGGDHCGSRGRDRSRDRALARPAPWLAANGTVADELGSPGLLVGRRVRVLAGTRLGRAAAG
jgi:hypothetical protein